LDPPAIEAPLPLASSRRTRRGECSAWKLCVGSHETFFFSIYWRLKTRRRSFVTSEPGLRMSLCVAAAIAAVRWKTCTTLSAGCFVYHLHCSHPPPSFATLGGTAPAPPTSPAHRVRQPSLRGWGAKTNDVTFFYYRRRSKRLRNGRGDNLSHLLCSRVCVCVQPPY
jgi:hypothetical protein